MIARHVLTLSMRKEAVLPRELSVLAVESGVIIVEAKPAKRRKALRTKLKRKRRQPSPGS